MKKLKIILLSFFMTGLSCSWVLGEALKSLDYHGRWPDASQRAAALDRQRNLLFLADGNVLTVLRSADLTVVSKLDLALSTGIRGLVINNENTYLYAACGKDGLRIIDVSDAENPIVAGSLESASFGDDIFGSGIACLAERVYVADVFYGLRVINVSDPVHPFQEAAYEEVNVNSDGEIFSGGHENLSVEEINDVIYVFVLDKYRGLRVFENRETVISHITNYPSTLSTTTLYATIPVTDIVIIDKQYAVIADYENGLVVIDLFSDAEKPDVIMITTLTNFETSGSAAGLSLSGNTLYVADGHSGMQIIDISDLSNPVISGNFVTTGAHSVIADREIAYLSDSNKGLQRINCAVKSTPTATHFFDTPSDSDAVFVTDGYVYSLDDDTMGEGLRIIQYSDDDQYELIGFCRTPGTALSVYVEGAYAYVADGSEGLTILDVTNLQSPAMMITINAEHAVDKAVDIYVEAGYAYVADENSGIFVFDIADPESPVLTGALNPGKHYSAVYARDRYLYAAHNAGIDIIEISDSSGLTIKGTWDREGPVCDIVAKNQFGYIAEGDEGFSLINISDPKNPFFSINYATAGKCEAVCVDSVYAHCAVGEEGVEVLGVTSINTPKLNKVALIDTPGYAADIFVDGNDSARFTYVADSSGGLVVFKHNDQYSGGIDEKPFTESTNNRGWDNACFISSLF